MNKLRRGIIIGTILSWSGVSLFQDVLGLERYIQHVRDKWIDASVTVPLAIVLIGIAIFIFVKEVSDE